MQQDAAGKNMALLDPVVAPRIAVTRLVTGLLQGLLLYWLYSTAQDKVWPATEAYLLGPLMLISLLLPEQLSSLNVSLGGVPLPLFVPELAWGRVQSLPLPPGEGARGGGPHESLLR